MTINDTSLAPSLDPQETPIPKPTTSIVLRAPTRGNETSPAVSGTKTYWRLSHTSRPGWKTRRNVLLRFTNVTSSSPARSPLDQSLEISYARESGRKGTTEVVGSRWEVLGQGRYGALEDWMVETEMGIEDSAGEIRADWRPCYLVLYFPAEDSRGEGFGLLTNGDKLLSDELVKEVEAALAQSCQWSGHFLPAAIDAKILVPEHEESKPQVWNNPDIYGEEESGRKCVVQ